MSTGQVTERIKELVYSTDESIRDIAKKAGLSKNAIYPWINGDGLPDACSIMRICKYFNVSEDWLLC